MKKVSYQLKSYLAALVVLGTVLSCSEPRLPDLEEISKKPDGGGPSTGEPAINTYHTAIRFHADSFFTNESPNLNSCAGDIRVFYSARSLDLTDNKLVPHPFEPSSIISGTRRPAFIENVSLDITNSSSDDLENKASSCSYGESSKPATRCAVLDNKTDMGTYATGFYSMYDPECIEAGLVVSFDPGTNKTLAGGAYIDLDRSQLAPRENIILNVTFFPMGYNNLRPDNVTNYDITDDAKFNVHLISHNKTYSQLSMETQPRFLTSGDDDQFPKIVTTLEILAPKTGAPVEKQILIPLAIDEKINRIRIERYSGSGILIRAKIFRMGGFG